MVTLVKLFIQNKHMVLDIFMIKIDFQKSSICVTFHPRDPFPFNVNPSAS